MSKLQARTLFLEIPPMLKESGLLLQGAKETPKGGRNVRGPSPPLSHMLA